jgi:hypothetical protein
MRAAAALALACAACGPSAYACTEQQQCAIDELVGVCQADGFCSFPDDGCPSGQRYGEHGGPMAGQCVPVADDTGTDSSSGTSTAATTSSSSTITASTTAVTVTESTSSSTDPATTTSATDPATSESTDGPIVEPAPLLWFSFDEPVGAGIPNQGSLGGVASCDDVSCPSPTKGVVGTGVIFDGVDDCAIFDHVPELGELDALTISAWLLREEILGNYDCVLCKPVGELQWNSWRLATYDDDEGGGIADFRVGLGDDTGISIPAPMPLAAWTHIVGTWDGATMVLWVDGEPIIESPNALYEFDEQPVYLGCDDDHGKIGIVNHLAGSVDEVRFYARALSDDEIAELFAEGM